MPIAIESFAREDELEAGEDMAAIWKGDQDDVVPGTAVELGMAADDRLLYQEAAATGVGDLYLLVRMDLRKRVYKFNK